MLIKILPCFPNFQALPFGLFCDYYFTQKDVSLNPEIEELFGKKSATNVLALSSAF